MLDDPHLLPRVLGLALATTSAAAAGLPENVDPPPRFAFDRVPDGVLLAFHPDTADSAIAQAHATAGARVVKRIDPIGVEVLAVPAGAVAASMALDEREPDVRHAEPAPYRLLALSAEDSGSAPRAGLGIDSFGGQRGLRATAQRPYEPDAGTAAANTDNADKDRGVAGLWRMRVGSLKVCRGYPSESFPLLGMCDVADPEGLVYAADRGYRVIHIDGHARIDASPPRASNITLRATGYKVKGQQQADLAWSGATSVSVDIWRDGALVSAPAESNDRAYTDSIKKTGGGSYTYKLCEAGTAVCSNEATVAF